MASTVTVEEQIPAPAEELWAKISDLTLMPRWSPEGVEVSWLKGASPGSVGARFKGTNRHGDKTWKSIGTVVDSEPGRAFAFRIKAGPLSVSEWRYTFEELPTGTRVTESWTDRRNPLTRAISPLITGVSDRAEHNRRTMEQTLSNLKEHAASR